MSKRTKRLNAGASQPSFDFVWAAPRSPPRTTQIDQSLSETPSASKTETPSIEVATKPAPPVEHTPHIRRLSAWAVNSSLLVFACAFFAVTAKIGLSTGPQLPFPVSAVTVFDKNVLPGALGFLVLVFSVGTAALKSCATVISLSQPVEFPPAPAIVTVFAGIYWTTVLLLAILVFYFLWQDIRDFLWYLIAWTTFDPNSWDTHTLPL